MVQSSEYEVVPDPTASACPLSNFRMLVPGSSAVFEAELATVREWFELPVEEKAQYSARTRGRAEGWTLAALTGPTTPARPRDYEATDVMLVDTGSIDALHPFFRPGVFPADHLITRVSRRLGDIFGKVLDHALYEVAATADVSTAELASPHEGFSLSSVRILYYPAHDTSLGFYAHTDYELLAIHFETSPGLEVRNPQTGLWERVPFAQDSLIVLCGEMAEIRARESVRACEHRVVMPGAGPSRMAAVFFATPGHLSSIDGGQCDVESSLLRRFGQEVEGRS